MKKTGNFGVVTLFSHVFVLLIEQLTLSRPQQPYKKTIFFKWRILKNIQVKPLAK